MEAALTLSCRFGSLLEISRRRFSFRTSLMYLYKWRSFASQRNGGKHSIKRNNRKKNHRTQKKITIITVTSVPGAGKISRASCIFSTRFTPTGWEQADGGPWNRLLCPRSIRSGFQPRPLVVRYAHAANFYILFRPQFFLPRSPYHCYRPNKKKWFHSKR